jgi:hypothetical protein
VVCNGKVLTLLQVEISFKQTTVDNLSFEEADTNHQIRKFVCLYGFFTAHQHYKAICARNLANHPAVNEEDSGKKKRNMGVKQERS